MAGTPEALFAGLLLWGAVALTLVRRAETRVSARSLPPPWGSAWCIVALAALAVAVRPAPAAAACGAACIALTAAAATDLRTGYLPDAVTLPAAVVATLLALFAGRTDSAATGVLVLVGFFGSLVAYSRGRWMGLGDVKAMYALGAAFGPFESLVAIFAACISGIALATLRGRAAGRELPFGPHLAVGAALTLVAGRAVGRALLGTS